MLCSIREVNLYYVDVSIPTILSSLSYISQLLLAMRYNKYLSIFILCNACVSEMLDCLFSIPMVDGQYRQELRRITMSKCAIHNSPLCPILIT